MMNTQENFNSIQWVEKTVHLAQLRPYEKNPRKITEEQFNKLTASLIRLGQFRPLLVTHDLKLAGGHQRLKAMRDLGWTECRVSIPQRPITDSEYRQLLLQDNHENGVWDMEELANAWDMEELQAVGLHDLMNIPTMEQLAENEQQQPKSRVCCPNCKEVFPVKGNKAE